MNSSGDSAVIRNAWLDSGYMCCIRTWRFQRITHNFYVDVNSNPEVFFLRSHAEWRSVLSRGLRCLEIWNSTQEVHVAGRLHDEGWRVEAYHTGDEFMSMSSPNSVRSTVQRISSGTF